MTSLTDGKEYQTLLKCKYGVFVVDRAMDDNDFFFVKIIILPGYSTLFMLFNLM